MVQSRESQEPQPDRLTSLQQRAQRAEERAQAAELRANRLAAYLERHITGPGVAKHDGLLSKVRRLTAIKRIEQGLPPFTKSQRERVWKDEFLAIVEADLPAVVAKLKSTEGGKITERRALRELLLEYGWTERAARKEAGQEHSGPLPIALSKYRSRVSPKGASHGKR